MEKRIVLEAVPHDNGVFRVEVIEQTHRCDGVRKPNSVFTSSMGLVVCSCSFRNRYFTIGSILSMQRIMHAIREYNGHVILAELPDVPAGNGSFIID